MRLHGGRTLFAYVSRRSWGILWQRRNTTKTDSQRSTPNYSSHLLTNSGPTIETTLVPIESTTVVPPLSELCSDTVPDRFRSGPVRFLSYVFT